MTAPIRPASTLVLVRPAGPTVEVFLSRRTAKAAFMANAYVYPGGRQDDADLEPALLDRLGDPRWEVIADFEDNVALTQRKAAVVTALRESFEEAGVLFAHRDDRAPVDAATRDRLAKHRAALNAGAASFLDILTREGLTLDPTPLRYFAHWITPPFETRRFDTRFFIAPVPPGQEPVPDASELVEGAWVTPARALEAHAGGALQLAPPTLCTLQDLAAAGDLDGVLAWSEAEAPVPILPRLEQRGDVPTLLLPGDPDYPSDRPARGPWRLSYADGRFTRH